ncbi:MAG TPA: aminopeptidase P family protein [Devosiaceae bacterium]
MIAAENDKTVFQSFEERSDPGNVAPRLKALRAGMREAGLDAFLVPRADAHRGESVPASEARLAYLTGFTGSAGIAAVTARKAVLFVDSRYTLQAPAQTDTALISVEESPPARMADWLTRHIAKGGKVGYDAWLHTPGEIAALGEQLSGHASLVSCKNLVDAMWTDRPAPPDAPVNFLDDERAGRSVAAKLDDLRHVLADAGADAVVLTLPESICWLFNMRGRDVPNTPSVLGFAIVPRRGKPRLFLAPAKIDTETRAGIGEHATLRPTPKFAADLETLGKKGGHVWIDPATCPAAVAEILVQAGATLIERRDPVLLPKAKKNAAEIAGMREAHRIDGVAMARFLHWLDREAPKGQLTEIDIVARLEAIRRQANSLVDISFDTISGAGPDGAIIHYRVTDKTNRRLDPGELMLVDSGGQYLSGTTDITRTMATGPVGEEERDRFTRVLKGMIAISMARFPKGTSGAQIDVLARQFLWQAGIAYTHGTGHGVGAFLGVHEGPAGISPRYTVPLEEGMILSNEPGYYKPGAYGIRIENLLLVTQSEIGGGNYLEFETLTLAPIDTRLIDVAMLTADERDWLDTYHKRVREEIGPFLSGEDRKWLEQATRAI